MTDLMASEGDDLAFKVGLTCTGLIFMALADQDQFLTKDDLFALLKSRAGSVESELSIDEFNAALVELVDQGLISCSDGTWFAYIGDLQ